MKMVSELALSDKRRTSKGVDLNFKTREIRNCAVRTCGNEFLFV